MVRRESFLRRRESVEFSASIYERSGSIDQGTRGYCMWQYGEKGWVVIKKRCQPGHHCGPPPREKGKFVGEIKRKFCVVDVHDRSALSGSFKPFRS
jgi:hypothetical protein